MRLTTAGKFLCTLAALVFAALAAEANAAVLVAESFTYADGNLVGEDPPVGGVWAAHSGAASTPVQVTSGQISLAQGGGTREDVNVPFETGAIGAGDSVYAGFDLTVPDPGAAITPVYFAKFLEGTSLFNARIWITTPTTSGFRLAMSNDNSISDADGEVFSSDLAFGTTYRIVSKYEYDTGEGTLWINPVDESSPSLIAGDPGFSDEVFAYAFRQATGNTVQVIDNLKVADNFAEAIPEPASAALVMLAALGMVGIAR